MSSGAMATDAKLPRSCPMPPPHRLPRAGPRASPPPQLSRAAPYAPRRPLPRRIPSTSASSASRSHIASSSCQSSAARGSWTMGMGVSMAMAGGGCWAWGSGSGGERTGGSSDLAGPSPTSGSPRPSTTSWYNFFLSCDLKWAMR